jgi:hypothetical protein
VLAWRAPIGSLPCSAWVRDIRSRPCSFWVASKCWAPPHALLFAFLSHLRVGASAARQQPQIVGGTCAAWSWPARRPKAAALTSHASSSCCAGGHTPSDAPVASSSAGAAVAAAAAAGPPSSRMRPKETATSVAVRVAPPKDSASVYRSLPTLSGPTWHPPPPPLPLSSSAAAAPPGWSRRDDNLTREPPPRPRDATAGSAKFVTTPQMLVAPPAARGRPFETTPARAHARTVKGPKDSAMGKSGRQAGDWCCSFDQLLSVVSRPADNS